MANDRRRNAFEIFWGEIAPCEHLVQIYEDDGAFLDSLEGFVRGGIVADEGVIVIATEAHRTALESRMKTHGIDLDAVRAHGHYASLDAEETLAKFMVAGWPDEDRFRETITELIQSVRGNGRRIRAFGEMVAILWAQGHNGATVRLEHLWHQFCQQEGFALFCAYPKTGFTQDAETAIKEICEKHSRVINESMVA